MSCNWSAAKACQGLSNGDNFWFLKQWGGSTHNIIGKASILFRNFREKKTLNGMVVDWSFEDFVLFPFLTLVHMEEDQSPGKVCMLEENGF
jgi:hypothetical protein